MKQLGRLICTLALGACAASEAENRSLRSAAMQHEADLLALDLQKAFVEENVELPQRLDFPVGTLHLHEFELRGRPGRAVLRSQFTFENTSGVRLDTPRVTLTVLDPVTGDFATQWLDLLAPLGDGMAPGATYTSWLEVETEELHLREGWERRLNVEARPLR
ncbi:MAG: hypothetical protein AAF682_10005 [Planctomycetota bacterium]